MAADSPLTVACVLRSGGEYHAGHVEGLRRQVERLMPTARFACLSDLDVPGERVALEAVWPGWWSKIALFDAFKERTLYLDLDTVLLADLSKLATGRFTMQRHWQGINKRDPRCVWLSPVMSWEGDYSRITRAFERVGADVMRSYNTAAQWGDQAFIAEQAGDVEGFPDGALAHYGLHCTRALYPPRAKAIVFAGKKRPWNCGSPWAEQHYGGLI